MDMQQERPPGYTEHEHEHDPESLLLPAVPKDIPTQSHDRLPGIRSLDLPETSASARTHNLHMAVELSPKSRLGPAQWGDLPPLHSATFPRIPGAVPRSSTDVEVGSPMDTASVVSAQDEAARRRETSVVSIDDMDVRLAAEALSDLCNPDFAHSPTSRSLTIPRSPSSQTDPEPLLSLITSNHPWLGGTINGSISAYNTTKTYSPRFVKYSAELIERNIGTPVVNTVSSVGRRTGVEQNIRRYLGEVHRRPSDLEQGDGSDAARKRQRVMSPADDVMDIGEALAMSSSSRTRGASQSSYAESLPAYDDQRSPKYEESAVVVIDPTTGKPAEAQQLTGTSSASDRRVVNWSTQLIMTTSGLGVALSETSLRSLRTCLNFLRGATKHIDNVMHALRLLLEQYEKAMRKRRESDGQATASDTEKMDVTFSHGNGALVRTGEDEEREAQVKRIAERMKELSSDIWATLQQVVQAVSRYTGGALPQNASQVVRTQLLSVPQRWQVASRSTASQQDRSEGGSAAPRGEEARGAKRMLAFAKEGLDMMGQITTVVDGTVQSAEAWLERIGKRTDGREGVQGHAIEQRDEKGFLVEEKI